MKAIAYIACLAAGTLIGAAGGILLAKPSAKDAAISRFGQLQLAYALVASVNGDALPDTQVATNAREALAMQLINTAPLYRNLPNDADRASLTLISKRVIDARTFDSIAPSDIRRYAYASAKCIADLPQGSDDPIPCLESSFTSEGYAAGMR